MPGGFYTPSPGDVIASANWITYVRNQTLNYFASAAARTSAISSPVEGMISYLSDLKRIDVYDGSAWQIMGFVPQIAFASRTADASPVTSNTTIADDTQLQIAVVATGTYYVMSHIIYTADTGGDLKIGWSGPASAAFNWSLGGADAAAASATASQFYGQGSIGSTDIAGGAGTGTGMIVRPTGILTTAGTAGTFKFRWAQGTSNVNATTVRNQSTIMCIRLA